MRKKRKMKTVMKKMISMIPEVQRGWQCSEWTTTVADVVVCTWCRMADVQNFLFVLLFQCPDSLDVLLYTVGQPQSVQIRVWIVSVPKWRGWTGDDWNLWNDTKGRLYRVLATREHHTASENWLWIKKKILWESLPRKQQAINKGEKTVSRSSNPHCSISCWQRDNILIEPQCMVLILFHPDVFWFTFTRTQLVRMDSKIEYPAFDRLILPFDNCRIETSSLYERYKDAKVSVCTFH